jgi:hypothetical protein
MMFAHVRLRPVQRLLKNYYARRLAETITLTSAISQRLVLCIRLIKPKRQRTVTPFQTSPSADKSLYVFNRIGIDKTETDWKRNTGG